MEWTKDIVNGLIGQFPEAKPSAARTNAIMESVAKRQGRDVHEVEREAEQAEQTTDQAHAELVREKSIAHESVELEIAEGDREVGYSARLLVQATMPHSKPPPDVTEFERTNGFVTVRIVAPKEHGLPFGCYPRLLLAWITTEAVRTKSHELELGRSLRDFMRKLDIDAGGDHMRRLRSHMQRLFSSMVSATYKRDDEWQNTSFCPIEGARIFWDPKRPDQASLWESSIILNRTFYEEITRRPVPIDMATLRVLAKSRSPMALDLYQWLTHRMSYLDTPTTIPWEALRLQFGVSQSVPLRSFKPWFKRHLKRVVELYPQAKVEPSKSGLKLLPSRTHVPKRIARGR